MDIGKNIREAREAQGLMVSEVARRAGLTVSGVTSIETGRVRKPAAETVVHIARALGIDPGELLKEKPDPRVVAIPSTPLTDTAVEDLDERLRNAESTAEVDRMLRAIHEEERDLEGFIPRHIAPKLDRARLYRAAILDRWVKLADNRRDPRSNRFKSVSEIASELGGRFKSVSETISAIGEQTELKDLMEHAQREHSESQATGRTDEAG